MTFSLFSTKINYHKNGIFWWSKLINRVIGEKNYNFLRLERRIRGNQIYYQRQQFLYYLNTAFPDVANALGTYPKYDASHGILNPAPYECFRDWQENSINSDGWYAMVVVFVCAAFSLWTLYCYLLPHFWITSNLRNENELRHRMKDYFASTVLEENFGNQYMENVFAPHQFHMARSDYMEGYIDPDDVRRVHLTTFNRVNKYREHYIPNYGNTSRSMRHPG